MTLLTVHRAAERVQLRVDRGLLGRAGWALRAHALGRRVEIVTDRTVGRLYAGRLRAGLRAAGLECGVATFPPGERTKSLESVAALYRRWSRAGVDRDTLIIALGGGVVSDLAGFAAATFARGLPWAVVPTTLLAQVDASIGGKVGVNLPAGKNLVGAYHQPRAVLADPDTLRTLTPRAYRSGLAEVAKMGVIARPGILRGLRSLAREGRLRDARAAEPLLRACARAKARLVSRDERDRGPRRILNFGHTVGHALEASYGYRGYTHGEAVAVGMVAALRLSVLEAGLDPVAALEVEETLQGLGLPTRLRRRPGSRFWEALRRDKKRGRGGLRVVLSPAIGAAKVFDLPSLTSLRRAVDSLVHPR